MEAKHKCDDCGKTYAQPQSLGRHLRSGNCKPNKESVDDTDDTTNIIKGDVFSSNHGLKLIPQNVSLLNEFQLLQSIGLYKKDLYPLVFWDQKRSSVLEKIKHLQGDKSQKLLKELLLLSNGEPLFLSKKLIFHHGKEKTDLSAFTRPSTSDEFCVSEVGNFFKIELKNKEIRSTNKRSIDSAEEMISDLSLVSPIKVFKVMKDSSYVEIVGPLPLSPTVPVAPSKEIQSPVHTSF